MTPAPLCAALLAGPGGKLADRFGQRVPAVPGALLFAAGCLWFVRAVGTEPAFVADWLVGAVLTGAGVGLAYPSLGSAALAELPDGVYGLGSALNSMFRQIGAVLGVAVVVAIVGTPTPAEAPAAFDDGWMFSVVVGASAALAGLALGRVRAADAAPSGAREPAAVEVSPL
jgi:MFS family permease